MKKVKNILFLSILNIVLISMTRVNATTNFKVGDYVEMTPSSTSFTIPKTLTGYESDQTINPRELNLWRIIRINDDGTVDMVSEYVSSIYVYFVGKTGYINYIGTLNYIAKQYENPNYTSGSRYMGYNGQTEYITDTTKIDQTTTAPWTSYTDSIKYESQGGGDNLSQTDITLVKNAIGSLKANKAGTTTEGRYWVASRQYSSTSSSDWEFKGQLSNAMCGGFFTCQPVVDHIMCHNGPNSNDYSGKLDGSIRPIVTLKSGIIGTSGDGQSVNSPWKLDIASTNEEEIKDSNNTNDTDNTNNNEKENNNLNNDNPSNDDTSISEQKPENKNEINNPQTGVTISILVLGILGVLATAIIYLVKKKSLFRKI